MRCFLLLTLALGLGVLSCVGAEIPVEDRLIIPGVRVGPIERGMTLAGLKMRVGAAKVKPYAVPVGEGETMDGAKVFAGTDSELHVIFNPAGKEKEITDIVIVGKAWKFDTGLRVGMTVEEVERINGAPFIMSGFGWDYGGFANFEGGRLAAKVSLRFNPPPGEIPDELIGEKDIPSTDKVLRKARPVVEDITILFPVAEDQQENKPEAEASPATTPAPAPAPKAGGK